MSLTESHLIGSTSIPLQETTYPKHFLEIVEKNPNKECFVFRSSRTGANIRHTYSQLLHTLNCVIQGFKNEIHMELHTVVAIYLPNCCEYVYSQLAALCGGYIMMPLNPLYTKPQLERLLPRVNPSVIISLTAMKQNIPSGYNICFVDPNLEEDPSNKIYSLKKFLSSPCERDYVKEVSEILKPSDVSFYGCTSGSTGEPKICTYTHFAMINPFITIDHTTNTPVERRRALCFTPLFTTAAHFQIDAIFAAGATVVVCDKFEPESILKFIQEEKITNVNCAPSGILALIHHPSFSTEKVKSVEHVIMGGAVVSDALMNEAQNKMGLLDCKSGYGMTETCGVMYTMTTTVGQLQPHYELRIVDHITRKITPVGVPGEIEVNTKIMMSGYLNNEKANKESYTEDGWFKTGDEGNLDKYGRLIITGRVKDMIIRGGHNVFPSEIVDTLQTHPNVVLSGCVSVPDRAQGELIVAFVTLKKETKESELKEYCRQRLVSFAVPTHIFIIEKMPLNSFGKVYNPELRKMAAEKIKMYWQNKCENNPCPPSTEAGHAIASLWSEWFEIPQKAISKEMNFFDIGGDSLVGSQTVGLIRRFVSDAPFDLLTKCPTIGLLEEYVLNPKLDLIHPQFKKDIEDIQNLKIEPIQIEPNQKKVAFLTGSNGFLGVHLIQALQKKGYHVLCLVRSLTVKFVTKAKVPFIYVSSIGVAACVGGKEIIPDSTILPFKANGYIQTKWMNELYLNKLRSFGYKIGILRPAFISGNSVSGCSNTDDFIWKLVRLLVNNGLSPNEQKMILTPVDLVANAFVESVNSLPIAANLMPLHPADISYVCDLVAKQMNKTIEHKPMNEIKEQLISLAQSGNKEVLSLLPSMQMSGSLDIEYEWVKEQSLDLSETQQSLDNSITYLFKTGFFGEEFSDGKTKAFGRSH
ncbi:AMP dependent CoA ligase, putative [Entamoeba dispar SAW760]|uniref:AMP dependent CoA ligase, putative n=1 Tax=Entamoeba dispar (strain ATCC PRA-260 / SAW760) TaxID=370354 RepID=B0E6H5_ENTDS|nr:AMP dependent CoA ligase, putative [Entamoeba dispar SAW760]EDR29870.1 AMP dependent CoA ligase, putative [Entamoeba dispar SAW760]|eukprot:EDR29870.1 AMP dependent CoA ligase, putative [Entamoeba dispar SAW760]